VNDYGQLDNSSSHGHKSSIGEAVDLLLSMFVERAYTDGSREDFDEPVSALDGVKVSQKNARLNPQHHVSTEGITITNPAYYAEKDEQERRLWKALNRGLARFRDLEDGLCLRCRNENDQPRRRYCSECEKKMV